MSTVNGLGASNNIAPIATPVASTARPALFHGRNVSINNQTNAGKGTSALSADRAGGPPLNQRSVTKA